MKIYSYFYLIVCLKKKRKGLGGSLSNPRTKIELSRHPWRMFVNGSLSRECTGKGPTQVRSLLDHHELQPGKYEKPKQIIMFLNLFFTSNPLWLWDFWIFWFSLTQDFFFVRLRQEQSIETKQSFNIRINQSSDSNRTFFFSTLELNDVFERQKKKLSNKPIHFWDLREKYFSMHFLKFFDCEKWFFDSKKDKTKKKRS